MNRVWPYCTEFEFFRFKKVLRAKNSLSLRMLTQALTPWLEPGQLIEFNYSKRNRPEACQYGDIVSYWDTAKVCAGVYLGKSSEGVQLLKRESGIEMIKPTYLLARIPGLRLPWYRRFLIRMKGPSALGPDPLLPRVQEGSTQKNRTS